MIGEPVHLNPPAHHHPLLHRVHIAEAFAYGWRTVISDVLPWTIMAGLGVAVGAFAGFATDASGAWLISLVGFAIVCAVVFILIGMALEATKGREVMTVASLATPRRLVAFLVATILYLMGAAITLALLILPGLIFLTTFFPFGLFISDLDLGPVEALRESRDLTRGQRLRLFNAGLVALAINLLGVLAFGVGVVLSIPITVVAAADIYEQLREEPIAEPI